MRALKPFGESVLTHFFWSHGLDDFRIEYPQAADGSFSSTRSLSITFTDEDEA